MKLNIRICRKCKGTSDIMAFRKGRNICKSCNAKYQLSWKLENREHLMEYRSTSEFKRKRAASVAKSIQKTPEAFLRNLSIHIRKYSNYKKKNQKKLNPVCLDVQIDYEYLLALYREQGGRCAIMKIPMTHEFNNLRSISVDRIDSSRGYIPGNVQLVCQFINTAKKDHSNEECFSILHEFIGANYEQLG